MSTDGERIFEARVVDETTSLHVDELCARLRIERQWIVELVELVEERRRLLARLRQWAE